MISATTQYRCLNLTRWLYFVLLLSVTGNALAIEEPKYSLIEQSGDFELRAYEPMIIAEVLVAGSMDRAGGSGFRLIADYIFGNNSVQNSAQVGSEKISMTAPVTMEQQGQEWQVHFVMPSEYTMATLPKPNNDRVQLREVPEKTYAVVRFSGLAGPEKVATKTEALMKWMSEQGLVPMGESEMARYNPPWTLPFMRRNEVMIEYQS